MEKTNFRNKRIRQVKANFIAFKSMKFNKDQKGKFALLRNSELIEVFDTLADSDKAAKIIYEDGIYSIQEIEADLIDLGYFSRHDLCKGKLS